MLAVNWSKLSVRVLVPLKQRTCTVRCVYFISFPSGFLIPPTLLSDYFCAFPSSLPPSLPPSLSSSHLFPSLLSHSPEPVVKPAGQELVSSRSVRATTLLLPGIRGQEYPSARTPLLGQNNVVAVHDHTPLPPTPPPDPISPPATGPMLVVTLPSPKHLDENSVSVVNVPTSTRQVTQRDKVCSVRTLRAW